MKIEKATNQNTKIDDVLITVSNFFTHLIKEISVTKYGSDKEQITFSPYKIFQYSDAMLKHFPKDALKTIEKTHLYSKQPVYYAATSIDRRIRDGEGIHTPLVSNKRYSNNNT